MTNLASLSGPSLKILGKTRGISGFQISGQSLIKENCHNSRTSSDITWNLDQYLSLTRETKQHQKIWRLGMSANWDIIVIFLIYGQFGAIWKSDSGCIVCKFYIFINSNLLSYKNWKQNWKISNTALTLFLWVKVPFLQKMLSFYKSILPSAKLRGLWH